MGLYEENLQLLSNADPELARQISVLGEYTSEFSPETVQMETEKWWNSLDPSNADVLFICGSALGVPYSKAEKWLGQKEGRYLVFLEDEPGMVKCLLETEQGKKILKDARAVLFLIPNEAGDRSDLFTSLAWYFSLLRPQISALPLYEKTLEKVKKPLSDKIMDIDAFARAHLNLGREQFENLYANYLHIDGCRLGKPLYGKFDGIPAIICGSGPSLAKNLHLLKGIESKALIFAGGTAIAALDRLDIRPHFGAVIDPVAPFRRFYLQNTFETPFFFQTHASSENLSTLHGEKLYIPDNRAHPIEELLKERAQLPKEQFGDAFTVAHLCAKIAFHMGCDPIIFVGMDLAMTNTNYYAFDIQQQNPAFLSQGLIPMKDIFGNPVLTKHDWKITSNGIAKLARENPYRKFLNATEGGIGFEGIPNSPLSEALATLHTGHDLAGHIHSSTLQCPKIEAPLSTIEEPLLEIKKNLETCLKLSLQLKQALREGKDYSLLESELKAQYVYLHLFHFFWEIIRKVGLRKVPNPLAMKAEEFEFYRYASQLHLNILHKALSNLQ